MHTMKDIYININKVAEVKGLKSTRSLRMAINKGKYQARTIPVNGGYSYEILYSSLEPEVQEKLEDDEIRSTALVPVDNQKPTFISESARMTSLARADIVAALDNIKNKYKTKKEAELFDLTKIDVYSLKGEFLCVARQVEKVHPMANALGTVKDMQDLKNKVQRQGRQLNKAKKEFMKCFPQSEVQVLEIETEPIIEIEQIEPKKTFRERKLTPREIQMNKPIFESDYEKYEWLISNGCTNPEDREWLTGYIRSDEYYNLYGGN